MVEDILMRIGSRAGLSKAQYPHRLDHGARIVPADKDHAVGACRLTPTYALHDRVPTARHTIHPLADLKPLDAKLYIDEIDEEKYVGTTKNYISRLEDLANVSQLIALVESVLDSAIHMDRDMEQSIGALDLTP